MKKIFLLCFYAILVSQLAAAEPRLRPAAWATPVLSGNLRNWHQLDEKVYRSAQPSHRGLQEASRLGITNVLNLRDHHSDDSEAKGLQIKTYRVAMRAGNIREDEVITALKIIRNAEGPVLIHCWHGSDRTGLICASYRMVFQNWSKEAAADELLNGGFGYHASIYKNITRWIQAADVEALKEKVFALNENEIRPTPEDGRKPATSALRF